ncbi:MAG: DNA repair protein RecO [Calditrichaeota bacterium]|nr:DNA repair protein RecO [Calditrichota bacterium]
MDKSVGPQKEAALVIKSLRYGESSRIITFFGEQHGKFAAMAKGIRRGKSSLSAGAVEPLSLAETVVYFKAGRSVQILAQAALIESFADLKNDLILNGYAAAALELLSQAFTEGENNPAAFKSTLNCLYSIQSQTEEPRLSLWRFQTELLEITGFALDPFTCPACGKSPAAVGRRNLLSLDTGAICCEICRPDNGETLVLSGEAVNILRLLARNNREIARRLKPSPAVKIELTSILHRFFKYHHPAVGAGPALQMLEKMEGFKPPIVDAN